MSKGEVELEPCPFCGGADIAASQDVCDAWTWGCADCAAEGPSAATKTEARVAWNRRAPATAQSRPGEEALREAADRLLFSTVDPTVLIDGSPVPAMTSLLYRVCDKNQAKFEEATRIVALFIDAALSIQALPVGGGGNKDHSSVAISPSEIASREADGDREPAGVRE